MRFVSNLSNIIIDNTTDNVRQLQIIGGTENGYNADGKIFLIGFVKYNSDIHGQMSINLPKLNPKCNHAMSTLIQEDESVVEDFIEIVGDIDFTSLTKKEVSYYVDVQTKLPPSRKKSIKYRNLSIREILDLQLKQKDCQTPQNLKKRLTKLNVFANWGIRQGVITFNPFSNMKFKVKKIPNNKENHSQMMN